MSVAVGIQGIVLLLCSDAILGAGGTCATLEAAVREGMADLDLAVEATDVPAGADQAGAGVPPGIAEATTKAGAACAVWTGAAGGGAGFVLKVYTPGSVQAVTDVVPKLDAGGKIDLEDAAFRLRSIVAAALYLDIPGIEAGLPAGEAGLTAPGPAFAPGPYTIPVEAVTPSPEPAAPSIAMDEEWPEPEPKASWLESQKRTSWARIAAGYAFLAYPTEEDMLYHGAAFSVGVLVLPMLELFADAVVTAPGDEITLDSATIGEVKITNSQYLVGVGLGWHFRVAGVLRVTPLVGFHVGISDTTSESGGDRERYRQANTAIWTGLDLGIAPAKWIEITIGVRIENLFNYENFELDDSKVFGLSQLRMVAVAGAVLIF